MKTVEYLPKVNVTAKSEAALKDLQQAWAYYTPEPQSVSRLEVNNDAAPLGYVPYYNAA